MAYTVDDFYVGQKVRIREWDDMLEEFGERSAGGIRCRHVFTEEMRHLCGKECTIKSMSCAEDERDSGTVTLKENGEFYFSTDMIEPADIPRSFDWDAFKNMLGI